MTRPTITIDPAVRFGRPQIKGITCEGIAYQVYAGDTVDAVMEDFDLTRDEVLLACWWAVRQAEDIVPSKRTVADQNLIRRWEVWAAGAFAIFAGRSDAELTDPPKAVAS